PTSRRYKMQTEYASFRYGFLKAMEEDYYLTLFEMDLPNVDFKAPNLDTVLEELFVESNEVIAKIKHKKGCMALRDYAFLGADLYMSLMFDSSYSDFEDSAVIDKYRLDLNFDYATGEDHDVGVYLLG